jgi:hypothetical protein
MFITEDQARERLSSPDNLANRFNINAARQKRAPEEAHAQETPSPETPDLETNSAARPKIEDGKIEDGGGVQPIEHRTISRPGQRRSWLPTTERTEIAIEAKLGERRQEEIAAAHGISQVAVAKIKAGEGLQDEAGVEQALEIARSKALDRLMKSLGLLTDDKISALNAREISAVAANMARVVEKTMPDKDRQGHINLVIYTPELRSEKSFEVVEVG